MKNHSNESVMVLRGVALAVIMTFGTSTSARAVCDGCVVGAVNAANAAITTSVAAVGTILTTGIMTLGQGIKGGASQVSQIVKETGTQQAQSAIVNNGRAAIRQAEERYSMTDPCSTSAPAQSFAEALRSGSGAAGSTGRGSGGTRTNANGNSQLAMALKIAEGKVAAPQPDVAAAIAASAGCGSFVDASNPMRVASCRAAGFSVGNANGFAGADINAATLFDGPQKAGQPAQKRFTVDMTADSAEEKAIAAFMRNMNVPLELASLKPAELSTDAGRRYMSIKDTFDARMSMAERPGKAHAGMISQNANTIPMLKELTGANGDAEFVTPYLAANAPNWQSKGVSANELVNLEVERRYMNLKWLGKTVSMSPDEIAREQLRLTALQNVLLWRANQTNVENGIMLGGLLGAAVRSEMLPQLQAAHAAAVR